MGVCPTAEQHGPKDEDEFEMFLGLHYLSVNAVYAKFNSIEEGISNYTQFLQLSKSDEFTISNIKEIEKFLSHPLFNEDGQCDEMIKLSLGLLLLKGKPQQKAQILAVSLDKQDSGKIYQDIFIIYMSRSLIISALCLPILPVLDSFTTINDSKKREIEKWSTILAGKVFQDEKHMSTKDFEKVIAKSFNFIFENKTLRKKYESWSREKDQEK